MMAHDRKVDVSHLLTWLHLKVFCNVKGQGKRELKQVKNICKMT